MRQSFSIYSVLLAGMLSFLLFVSFHTTDEKNEKELTINTESSTTSDLGLPQVIRTIEMNKVYTFAGEPVPAENFDAIERLDRELAVNSYYHSSTILNIKRANRFFPIIERILAEKGIPDDFKYLAVAESGLQNATSSAGAKGYWQFLKAVGQQYGLEINGEIDERYHIEKSTKAACKMLNDYHRKFGSWTLVAAAYNMGIGRLSRLKDTQKANTYYELNVNEETSRYVFRIMAIKEILSNPTRFGFQIDADQLYQPLNDYAVVEVKEPVENWGDFAIKYGTNYRILKVYNPWLIDTNLTNSSRKTYEVRIPRI
jgi:hypothetical protein